MNNPLNALDDLFSTKESIDEVAADLNISSEALLAKIEGKDDFYSAEMLAIAKHFQLSGKEILEIFFPQPLNETVADNIKKLNGNERPLVNHLADIACMEPEELFMKINCKEDFTISELERIAQALNKPAAYFLERHS